MLFMEVVVEVAEMVWVLLGWWCFLVFLVDGGGWGWGGGLEFRKHTFFHNHLFIKYTAILVNDLYVDNPVC